jgi:immune inhibitor A
MSHEKNPCLLEQFEKIYSAAEKAKSAERCLVAPSPELQEKLRKELEELRDSASPTLARVLRAREQNRVGFNDGLIFPGSHFPVGTPAHLVRSSAADRAPLRGDVRVVVVLVDFSDEQFSGAHDQQHYEDLFFSEGVLPNGSVREYFADVTGGIVRITGEVVGPYRMPHTLAHYANGAAGTGSSAPNARNLAEDAAGAANADVDFSIYDNDGDGFVDAFIVLQAGPGGESTGNSGHIWSHKWVMPSVFQADGAKIYAYLTIPEEARIGVSCHELGHLLFGFPDLYDTDYSSSGVGNWCLMGGGSWNGNGDVPAHPSAWCKANQEWVSVINPTANSSVSIDDVKTSRTVYRLWKDGGSSNEYFLVENRQRAGYDQLLPGDGLLVWRIDDAVSTNADETHPKVALVQADNRKDLENGNNRGDTGDPFPGAAANQTFNASSSPSSRSYGNMDTCVALENISASGGVITANFRVKCAPVKRFSSEKALHKELRKELSKDYFKDHIKERVKEHTKEIKEKDFKELKERKEFKEKDKDFEGPGGFRATTDVPSGAFETGHEGTLDARIAALEEHFARLMPFIDEALRPDLAASALADEEDLRRRSNARHAAAPRAATTGHKKKLIAKTRATKRGSKKGGKKKPRA